MHGLWSLLGSRLAFRALVAGWAASFVFSFFVLAPNIDDGYYLLPSLEVLRQGVPGIWIGDSFRPVFFILPTFSFLQGLFFEALGLLGVGPGPITYRLFGFLCLAAALTLGLALLARLRAPGTETSHLPQNLFLLTLAVTPFAQVCWVARPEPLALACVTGGLLALTPAPWRETAPGPGAALLAGLLLGVAATVHPIFLGLAGLILAIAGLEALAARRFARLAALAAGAAAAPLALLAWLLANREEAVMQIGHRSGEAVSRGLEGIDFLLANALPWLGGRGFLVEAYNAAFWAPLLLIWPLAAILYVVWLLPRLRRDAGARLIAPLLPVSIAIVFLMKPFYPYFLDVAFLVALTLGFIAARSGERLAPRGGPIAVGPAALAGLLLFALAGLHSLAHASKYVLAPKDYFHAPRLHAAVASALGPEERLLVNTARLVPPLADLFVGADGRPAALQPRLVFQVPNRMPPGWREPAGRFLGETLPAQAPGGLLWGLDRFSVTQGPGERLCVALPGSAANLMLTGGTRVFEDAKHIFQRPARHELGAAGESCASLLERPAD